MKPKNVRGCKEYAFSIGACSCSFKIRRMGRTVFLYGEEAENGKTIFRLKLAFSSEQAERAEGFARTLAESQTMPRMMAELAEDYFSFSELSE